MSDQVEFDDTDGQPEATLHERMFKFAGIFEPDPSDLEQVALLRAAIAKQEQK